MHREGASLPQAGKETTLYRDVGEGKGPPPPTEETFPVCRPSHPTPRKVSGQPPGLASGMSATSSGSQDWDHSGSSQALAGTGGFLGGALYGGSRIPGGSSGPPHIPPACSKGREIASRQRGVAGCQRPSADGLGELGHTSLWEVQRWRLRDLRRRGSGTPSLGAQGPRSLGSGEMRVGEEKGAEHKMGSGDGEGTCVGGKERGKRKEGGEGGGEYWVLGRSGGGVWGGAN